MATPHTNEGWQQLIDRVEHETRLFREEEETKTYPDNTSVAFRRFIDHTVLKLDATAAEIDQLCREAVEWNFASVCVRPEWVKRCGDNLAQHPAGADGKRVLVASVIGFHEGDYPLEHKLKETEVSLSAGAHELDIVVNWKTILARDYVSVHKELMALRAAAPGATLKLILETSRLFPDLIVACCTIAGHADFDFVKTSTGFDGEGATIDNVKTMYACAEVVAQTTMTDQTLYVAGMRPRRKMKVKASGGIKDLASAEAMLRAGALRLGCSAGVKIAQEAGSKKNSLPDGMAGDSSTTGGHDADADGY